MSEECKDVSLDRSVRQNKSFITKRGCQKLTTICGRIIDDGIFNWTTFLHLIHSVIADLYAIVHQPISSLALTNQQQFWRFFKWITTSTTPAAQLQQTLLLLLMFFMMMLLLKSTVMPSSMKSNADRRWRDFFASTILSEQPATDNKKIGILVVQCHHPAHYSYVWSSSPATTIFGCRFVSSSTRKEQEIELSFNEFFLLVVLAAIIQNVHHIHHHDLLCSQKY